MLIAKELGWRLRMDEGDLRVHIAMNALATSGSRGLQALTLSSFATRDLELVKRQGSEACT
jgi:hypothetical protein